MDRCLPARGGAMIALSLVWAAAPLIISFLVCALMIRLGPKDAPDGGRKTQSRPVPSAGGVGVLAGVLGALFLASLLQPGGLGNPVATLAQIALAGPMLLVLIAGLLGFADDRLNLPAGRKLLILAAAALLAAIYGPHVTHFWLPGANGSGYVLPAFLAIAGAALWLFIMANAVNFMDGANGIAMGSAAILLAALAVITAPPTGSAPGILFLLLVAAAAAVCGFLAWNLAGRLYAGDTGALAIGALMGGAGLSAGVIHSVWVPATLALPILLDVILTLIWRARLGRPLMQAHRDHAYQLFLRAGWSHLQVAGLWWGFCLITSLAAITGARNGAGVAAALFAFMFLAGSALWGWQRIALGRHLASENK
ncbi:glycosyl transferase family protein [Hyphomonas hirschiana VP5]|nr:glycosyl transferase family protein [Hyphomonas hirschiana VP5]